MNIKEFSEESPGQLVSISSSPMPEHAFIPAPLPPVWEFPTTLWPLLAEAKKEIALLEGIARGLPNPSLLLKPLSGREAIQSSALEGTYATAQELLLFEMDPPSPASDDERTNAKREVANYRRALEYGAEAKRPLSLRLLREMHELLMTGVRGSDKTPGQFRIGQVAIGANRRFVPPPPLALHDYLHAMQDYLQEPNTHFDPLIDCFLVHYQFEAIHPFNDGNGRVGRLLLAIMLQQACTLSRPWLYLSEFFNQHRDEYIQRLFNVSTKGQWTEWVEFCLIGTLDQATDTINRCEKLTEIKASYLQRLQESRYSARLMQVVEKLFEDHFLEISDIRDLLKVTDPTARADAERLVDLDILDELPGVWPKTYYAPEVFRIAYEKID